MGSLRSLRICWLSGVLLSACGSGPQALLPPDPLSLDPELRQRVETARAELERAPEDAERWAVLGMTYEGGDVYSQAALCYRHSLELVENPRRLYRLSAVQARMGTLEEAVESMRRVIALAPDYAPAHWRLGSYLQDLGRSEEALAAYGEAVGRDSGLIGAWLGIAKLQLELGNIQKSIQLLERLRQGNPEHAQILMLLRTAYFRAGRNAEGEAITVAWHAVAFQGRDPWQAEFRPYQARPLIERAREQLESGHAAEALALLRPFVEGEGSEDWNARGTLALALVEVGQPDQALALLESTLKSVPENTLVLRKLAFCQERGGDVAGACATLERIRGLDPGNLEVVEALARLKGGGR